jgi:acetate kinase
MGMTPTDGLIMPSRSGSIDPAVMIHLMEHHGCRRAALPLINSESGLKGISGISSDIHDIETAASDGHHRALLAHKAFCYQVRKNIGAYVAAMGGIDVLAFTGDIGETSATVRSLACQGLGYMGIKLDEEKNRNLGRWATGRSSRPTTRRSPSSSSPTTTNAWWPGKPCAPSSATPCSWPPSRKTADPHRDLGPPRASAQADVEAVRPRPPAHAEHELSQPGQFACAEKVHLVGPKGASPTCACSARPARKPRSRSP